VKEMNEPAWLIYFDASALVKRYAPEPGTALVNEIFRLIPAERMVCATLGMLEAASILLRQRNDGRLTRAQYEQAMAEFKNEVLDSDKFILAQVNDSLQRASLSLVLKHNINASDAVVLRSAINWRDSLKPPSEDLMLWTSDNRLARAATAEGIKVFNPETETEDTLRQLLGISQQSPEQL